MLAPWEHRLVPMNLAMTALRIDRVTLSDNAVAVNTVTGIAPQMVRGNERMDVRTRQIKRMLDQDVMSVRIARDDQIDRDSPKHRPLFLDFIPFHAYDA